MHVVSIPLQSEWLVSADTLKVTTDRKVGLYNLTDRIMAFIEKTGLQEGIVVVSTLHTTTAIFINEFQDALLRDIQQVLEDLVREDQFYYHNCDDYSDCERRNATAHLRSLLLGHQVVIPVHQGRPAVGTWQSIILAELDGPRTRSIHVQAMGIPRNGRL